MPMKPYPIPCYGVACRHTAAYKIASRWSDGQTAELKTYAMACENCLPALYRDAERRHGTCRLSAGETLDAPSIFDRSPEAPDRFRNPRRDLEASFRRTESAS